jgi:hypothetical protein
MSITKAVSSKPFDVGDSYDPNPVNLQDLPPETRLAAYDVATLNFGTFASSGNANSDMSVSGSTVGSPVDLGLGGTVPAGILVGGAVTADGEVNMTNLNLSGTSYNASSVDVRAVVWGPA